MPRLASHVRCELRLGWDQPSQRSKLSTWKLDSNPAIEICSWDASQYTATAIHQINQNCALIKTNQLLFTQNRIQHSTHFAQSEFKWSPSLSDHCAPLPRLLTTDWPWSPLPRPHQHSSDNRDKLNSVARNPHFLKINLSPEREEERAVNTNLPRLQWQRALRLPPTGPIQIKITNNIFCKHSNCWQPRMRSFLYLANKWSWQYLGPTVHTNSDSWQLRCCQPTMFM